MRLATRCTILLFGVLLASSATAVAQTCMQDEFQSINNTTKTLGCTANDVSVAGVDASSIHIFQGGVGNKCLAGGKFSFTALFDIKTTSNKTRSNIGIFFGTGQANALTGTCSQEILAPLHPCGDGLCGDALYEELDTNGETAGGCTDPNNPSTCTAAGCGDTSSADSSPQFGAGTHAATLEVDNVTCPTSGTTVTLPVCTSWFQPTANVPVCTSAGPLYNWVPAAIAGTSSKCTCGTVDIPVQPIEPSVSVSKTCNANGDTTPGLKACNEGAGDVAANTVTYHVAITNTTPAGEGAVIVDQICDSLYGQIFPASGTCPLGTIGSQGNFISTTCTGMTINNVDTPPNTGSCDFTVHQNENLTLTDTVTVAGHSSLAPTDVFPATASNTVTVTSTDSPTTSTTTKGLDSTQAACATVRYNVTVANTSGADEIITLSKPLNDSAYGDITTVHGSVLGTTCGVAVTSPGLGSLSGKQGAGVLPDTIATGGNYSCQFDGQFCGSILPAAEQFGTGTCNTGTGQCSGGITGSCTKNSDCDLKCTGISQTDTVTGTITGDDTSPADTVSQTTIGLNVTECLASFASAKQ